MTIHSTHLSVSGTWPSKCQARRLLSFCGAVVLCIMMSANAAAQSRAFAGFPGPQSGSSNTVRNGLFVAGGETYQVVDTAAYQTAADVGRPESGSVAQVGFQGSCRACGTACGGRCGGSYGACGEFPNPCNPCCTPFLYGSVEALFIELDEDLRHAAREIDMGELGFEWGTRITIGSVSDCFRGCEVGFTGPLQWDVSRTAVDPGFGLGTLLTPGNPVDPSELSAFSNADVQSLSLTADYWSLEFNRTVVGWEVAKLLAGVRYISYEEQLAYYSQNISEAGLLFTDVDNRLFGLQVGLDLLYPICKHAYTDFRSRLGGFINSANSNFFLDNAGSRVVRSAGEETDISVMLEVGTGLRYQLGQMLSIRSGIELWYLSGVAGASGQVPFRITPTTGRSMEVSDDLFLVGFSLGAELKY